MLKHDRGFTLLEVLITMLILMFGLLALANLQAKMNLTQMESYQRAQAVVLMQDMLDRIANNRSTAATYMTGSTGLESPAGAPNTVADCTAVAMGAARDKCEWGNALLGAGETQGGSNIGAMIGARGCVEQLQAADTTPGTCRPAIFRVTVAWQGSNPTVTPNVACGQNQYGTSSGADDRYRRAITQQIVIGLPTCS